jgi:hypothetical protein
VVPTLPAWSIARALNCVVVLSSTLTVIPGGSGIRALGANWLANPSAAIWLGFASFTWAGWKQVAFL